MPFTFEVAISQNGRSIDTCPQLMVGLEELWLSGLREFLFNISPFLLE
jgi:ribosome modulation factor